MSRIPNEISNPWAGSAVRICHVKDGETDGLPDGVIEVLAKQGYARMGFGSFYVTSAFWEKLKAAIPESN